MPKDNIFTNIKRKLTQQPSFKAFPDHEARSLSLISVEELVVMKTLWQAETPLTSWQLSKICPDKCGLNEGDMLPRLSWLSSKGLVKVDTITNERGSYQLFYSPLVTEAELRAKVKDPLEIIKARYDFFFGEL